jgi:hypothetical protein
MYILFPHLFDVKSRKLGISEHAHYRWKKESGRLI